MSDLTIEVKNDAMLGRLEERNLHLQLIEKDKEIERLKNKIEELELDLQDTISQLADVSKRCIKAIFFIQNQELHKSKDTTGSITMKERELIDILGSDKNEKKRN